MGDEPANLLYFSTELSRQYTYKDRYVHKGQWKNDKKEGTGIATFADGGVYRGILTEIESISVSFPDLIPLMESSCVAETLTGCCPMKRSHTDSGLAEESSM